MEDNTSYTYTYEKEEDKPEHSLKVYFVVLIILLFVAAIVLGVALGKKTAAGENETTMENTTAAAEVPTESVTEAAEVYKPGSYSVNTEGYSLRFRKEHSKDSEAILEIADKTKLVITEIYFDENADDEIYRYWGKTDYLGHEGWLTMIYLKKEYSDNIITPDDITDNSVENTSSSVEQSSSPTDTTDLSENTTISSSDKYSVGDYKVATGGYTLRLKKSPGRDTEVLASIPDGTNLTVLEVVEINETEEAYRFWGKVLYNGHTGYVSMLYLAK